MKCFNSWRVTGLGQAGFIKGGQEGMEKKGEGTVALQRGNFMFPVRMGARIWGGRVGVFKSLLLTLRAFVILNSGQNQVIKISCLKIKDKSYFSMTMRSNYCKLKGAYSYPGCMAQLVGMSFCAPKGCQIDTQSGHQARQGVGSPVGVCAEGSRLMFLSHIEVSPSPSLKIKGNMSLCED